MHLILTGFKGVGKSFLGRCAAERLSRPFIDSDELLLSASWHRCSTIRELYLLLGEEEFRLKERKILRSWISTASTPSVLATGGGTLLDLSLARECAAVGEIFCLEASLETLEQRGITHAAGELRALYAVREPLYRALPAVHLCVDGMPVNRLLDVLCQQFEETVKGNVRPQKIMADLPGCDGHLEEITPWP